MQMNMLSIDPLSSLESQLGAPHSNPRSDLPLDLELSRAASFRDVSDGQSIFHCQHCTDGVATTAIDTPCDNVYIDVRWAGERPSR